MSLADFAALFALGGLVIYAILGGADFGGGVWDLLSRGPRAGAQRAVIERAIAPVWEANHVWLIVVVVILFTGFPVGFAAIGTALHVPLTLLLVGIVLRGTAFTFRHYDHAGETSQKRWGRVFAVASAVTPLFLGIVIGAISSGDVRLDADGVPTGGFFRPWMSLFSFAVGLLTIALFSFLAAVFLTVEAGESDVAEDFRRRAIGAGAAVFLAAMLAGLSSGTVTSGFGGRLIESWWSAAHQVATGVTAIGSFAALFVRRYRLARLLAASQVALILVGWGLAQAPYLVAPDLTLAAAAAPDQTLRLLLIALVGGSALLFPSLYYLFRVFKRGPAFAPLDDDEE